jgi:hypothetical protein
MTWSVGSLMRSTPGLPRCQACTAAEFVLLLLLYNCLMHAGEAFYDMERGELDEKYSRAPPVSGMHCS